jgi:alkanesulfonate monooxygenase SsuD/methylene tetrahydromethanopterin reductase-like flavin-dependent oxidoreductase (luciferase family)
MIEGQNGLNWRNWKKIVQTVEDCGFYGLYRSDHFTNASLPDKDSLELWVSLTYLAISTKKIIFGPLVSPISFRNPVFTARMANAVDELSEGRIKLGLGAGWQEREHHNYGFELLSLEQRFLRFEEGLKVISGLFSSNEPFSFSGEYFTISDAVLLPKPYRPNGPEILIGGNGEKYTFPKVISSAKEWNAIFLTPEKWVSLNEKLDQQLQERGRNTNEVRRSLMTNLTYGKSESDLIKKLNGKDQAELKRKGIITGTTSQVIDQLHQYKELGLAEIMLQWIDLEDMDGLIHFAGNVLPKFQQ